MELKELIQSIDIVEYISQYIELEQRGEEWWGLSCFTDEKTPSFSVRRDPAFFYDYSSGQGGNVWTFVKLYNKCSNQEAVEILKKYAGVDGEVVASRQKMNATMDCLRFQKKNRTQKESAGTKLSADCMCQYENRPEKLEIWEKEGISRETLEKFQVRYDGFSNRLVYPIKNMHGEIVNVGGRTLDTSYKEKKLRKYIYFYKWGTVDTIFGLSDNMKEIKKKQEVILFEGVKSVFLADSWGIKNTGAILTSHLSLTQAKILVGLGVRVVFALDKDVDVRKDKNIQILKDFVNTEFILDRRDLIGEKDSPVDRGQETFEKLYNERLRIT